MGKRNKGTGLIFGVKNCNIPKLNLCILDKFMAIFKNKITYLTLAIIVISAGVFWYLKHPKANSEVQVVQSEGTVSETNNDNDDIKREEGDEREEVAKPVAVLSEMPKELSGLNFSDPYQKEDYDAAIKAEDDIKKDGKNYDNYNVAAFYWKSLGDLTKKEVYYRRAIEVYAFTGKLFENKKVYQPYQNLANVYISLKEYENAEKAMKDAIVLAPEVGSLYIKLADIYQNLMKSPSQKIIDLYESALHQSSYQPDILFPAYASYLCGIDKGQEALNKTKLKCEDIK